MISLRQFKQFIVLAEELNFNRAAKRLHMSQPPLTAAIQKLEKELQVSLFERNTRSVKLTTAGETFLVEARRTITQFDRALYLTQQAAIGYSDSLRLSFIDSTLNTLLPTLLGRLKDKFKGLDIQLQELTTNEQLIALQQDKTDLGIIVLPTNPQTAIHYTPLLESDMLAAVATNHPLANKQAISLNELANEPWVLFAASYGQGLYSLIIKACATAGFIPQVSQTTKQLHTTCSLVAGGLGVALMPRPYTTLQHAGVKFIELVGSGTPIPYNLAIAYKTLSPLSETVIAMAQEAVQSLPPKSLSRTS